MKTKKSNKKRPFSAAAQESLGHIIILFFSSLIYKISWIFLTYSQEQAPTHPQYYISLWNAPSSGNKRVIVRELIVPEGLITSKGKNSLKTMIVKSQSIFFDILHQARADYDCYWVPAI